MTSHHITIRAATLKDTEAIFKIYQATIEDPAERDDDYWESLIRRGGMFIATWGGTAIGFGGIDIHATEQIRYVYVVPAHQKSDARLGSRILEALEAVARQEGIFLIRLHSTPNAVGFYEKAGYSAVDRNAIVGHDHPGVEMAKELRVRRQ
jgi:ribosomal protein S18 acetylase RimI-like enzyme